MDTPTVDEVTELLYDVIDPELGINIVDLGLLYNVMVIEDRVVILKITLTSAACPLQDVIQDQVESVLINSCSRVVFDWVWAPAWNPTMITDSGREQLNSIGYSTF